MAKDSHARRDRTGREEGLSPAVLAAQDQACAWEQSFYLNFLRIATIKRGWTLQSYRNVTLRTSEPVVDRQQVLAAVSGWRRLPLERSMIPAPSAARKSAACSNA